MRAFDRVRDMPAMKRGPPERLRDHAKMPQTRLACTAGIIIDILRHSATSLGDVPHVQTPTGWLEDG